MRTPLAVLGILALAAFASAQQEKPSDKLPEKGDSVVVRGCLSGAVLEASEIKIVDGTGKLASSVTFRLTGEKNLIKQMRKDQNGKVVEVTGVLKSELPQGDARRGKRIGNTRIVVGVGTPHSAQPQGPPPMPVLDVKSYEGIPANCAG